MNERHRDRCLRKIDVLPLEKLKPFIQIVDRAKILTGTQEKTAELLGVSWVVLRKMREENYLTTKSARKILDCWKARKSSI